MAIKVACLFLVLISVPSFCKGREPPWVVLSRNGKGFELEGAEQAFVPWGLNYDHDASGRLLEDYWESEWSSIEQDFAEMKQLGCNVVRIHLQFGKFMQSPSEPIESSLQKLSQLIDLAEQHQMYLNVTGLGCYHKQDVPAWYDALTTEERWSAQANFWSAVAKIGASRSAIFCYDLMNEPVVHGGDKARQDWLGPGFGGKHFVQFINRSRAHETRQETAIAWTEAMVRSIRQHDKKHLITIGLVPWSLDRPGLTSGFNPHAVAPHLDFLSVHIYPETGKIDEAMATLRDFAAVGKPVVIEEIFPLKCNAKELETFIKQSTEFASGWIGFYWGEPVESLREQKTIAAAITISWLELFKQKLALIRQ